MVRVHSWEKGDLDSKFCSESKHGLQPRFFTFQESAQESALIVSNFPSHWLNEYLNSPCKMEQNQWGDCEQTSRISYNVVARSLLRRHGFRCCQETKKLHLPYTVVCFCFLSFLFLLPPSPSCKWYQIKHLEYRETSNFGYLKYAFSHHFCREALS